MTAAIVEEITQLGKCDRLDGIKTANPVEQTGSLFDFAYSNFSNA